MRGPRRQDGARASRGAGAVCKPLAPGRVRGRALAASDRHLDALEADTAQARAAVRAAIWGRR